LRLDRFIYDIINFSKNTRIDVVEEEIELKEMIGDILEDLKYMDGFERIKKDIDIFQTVPFVSDLFRLKIICNNLISNAIKYSSMSKKTPCILIKIVVNEREALFDFVDNGVGIAKENTSKVFDMFFRASSGSKGSGLGLYIVKEIVQKLKGDITVKSKLGEGTTFTVVLPNKHI
jgi:signal transduction histidine kinase